MIEFKKPLEIFRVNADATFELGKGVDPLVALGELSKAFMKQQHRIKRLEEAGDDLHFGWIDGYMNQRRLDEWLKAKESKP